MKTEFYYNYSVNYSKLLLLNNEAEIVGCLYISKIDGSLEWDSWIENRRELI